MSAAITLADTPDTLAGSTERRDYSGPSGSRSYDLYVPDNDSGQPMPLVVMLHGSTQDPVDFATGTGMNELADEHSFVVAYPAQPRSANMTHSWNWYRSEDQSAGAGEPSIIAGITAEIAAAQNVDEDRIYVAGLSAGGAMAAVMAATYPEVYAAVGVHSGLAYQAASNLFAGLMVMNTGGASPAAVGTLPLIVFHGDADSTVAPVNAAHLITARVGSHSPFEAVTVAAGAEGDSYAYTRTVHPGPDGTVAAESWLVHGQSHAWSGGNATVVTPIPEVRLRRGKWCGSFSNTRSGSENLLHARRQLPRVTILPATT